MTADGPWLAVLVLTLLSVAVVGLMGIWIALGRGHWFVRAAVVGAALSLLLLVPAYEPLVLFIVQLLVAVPILVLARRLRDRATGRLVWQFTTGDLLGFTAVVAGIMAVIASVPVSMWHSWHGFEHLFRWLYPVGPAIAPWHYAIILGVASGVITLFAAWIVVGRLRPRIRAVAFAVVYPAALAGFYGVFDFGSLWPEQSPSLWCPSYGGGFSGPGLVNREEVLFLYVLGSLVPIVLWLRLARASDPPWIRSTKHDVREIAVRNWRRWTARVGWLVLTLILLGPLAWAYVVVMTPPAIPRDVLPNPNGYDLLFALGTQLETAIIPNDGPRYRPSRPAPQVYFDFERSHPDLPVKARACLAVPSLVPIRYDGSDHHIDMGPVERPVDAMIAAGRAASLRGDWPEATRRYVDAIRLARQSGRGGVLGMCTVAHRRERFAKDVIHADLAKMPSAQRRWLSGALAELGEQREPLDALLRRTHVWLQRVDGWWGRLAYCVDELSGQAEQDNAVYMGDAKYRCAVHRILLVELALEGYREKHKTYPDQLGELVPDDLKEIPLDPFSGRPLIYRHTATGYLLYSVGRNRQDDGGAIWGSGAPGADDVRFE